MLPTNVSGSHVLSRFYFCSLWVCAVFDHFGYPAPPIGDWRHVKWYNLRSVQQTLEEMQQRITSGLTLLPPLQIASALGPPARSTTTPGPSASKRSHEPDSSNNRRPQYEDMFEDSDDSTESFDGPFPGPSLSAVASSTTGTTSQTSK